MRIAKVVYLICSGDILSWCKVNDGKYIILRWIK